MTLRKKIFILFFIQALIINAQDSLFKKNSVGLGISCSASQGTPDLAKTIGAFFKYNRQQVFIGADIYSIVRSTGTIAGGQLGYQFCLNKPTKNLNVYAIYTFQYVQFGQGTVWAVPYNYLPTDEHRDYNLWRTKSMTNALGLRVAFDFLKIFSTYMEISGGYNYSERAPSPTNQYYKMDLIFDSPTNLIFTPYLKAGLNFKIHNW